MSFLVSVNNRPPLTFQPSLASVGMRCAILACLLIAGCHGRLARVPDPIAPPAGEPVMVRTELYFGLSQKGGGVVTAQEFDAFVDEVITPRFPDGFTIVDAVGQWRDSTGNIIWERSKLLIVLHDSGERAAKAIEEIRDLYKSKFGQESVMRVTSTAGVSF